MTVKQILPFGDAILRKKAKPAELNQKTFKLLDDMIDTLYAAEGRAGLAAPQIGILRRVVVMDCGEGLTELINPEIISMNGEQTGAEGCLSFPGYHGFLNRATHIEVRSLTRQGDPIVYEASGDLARCMQHEIDHLNGILYVDHVKEQWLYHDQTRQRISMWDVIQLSNQDLT